MVQITDARTSAKADRFGPFCLLISVVEDVVLKLLVRRDSPRSLSTRRMSENANKALKALKVTTQQAPRAHALQMSSVNYLSTV